MASVLQQYSQLADFTATQITGSYQSWTDFLTTAARLYKYPYHEQLMIYAQRPDATACADYELWNKRMGRYVRRGAKGIALIDHSGDAPKLKYVFDVADTRTTERSRSPYLWEYRPEHEQAVSAALEEQFAVPNDGSITEQLEQISSVKVTEYFLAHQQDMGKLNPEPPRREITQSDIDKALQKWNGSIDSKRSVVRYMEAHARERDTAAWLAKEYGADLSQPLRITVTGADSETVLPWAKVQRRIAQIAFIHDANTEVKKKELFGKVRSGQVRVLLGSTSKMGAGTNVQDRLVAIHDLDCPWRPGDLQQRKGRIERQGNQNEKVHVFRYVTEGTFDAFLWQTVENKQKFISQIMTSKSPVRSCNDVDEVALSFAEIKALCAGDPRIKERMDLDVEVSRLKIMKADHKSKQYRLEDSLLRHFPEQVEKLKGCIQAIQEDMNTLEAHPHPTDGFAGMTVLADELTDKDNAGAALIEAAKKATGLDPVEVGTYRGFQMSVTLEDFGKKYVLTMQGRLKHQHI